MLEYREINYAEDIPEIAQLLRTSLSETNNEAHFIWKHLKNPFGISYGLLACDGNRIVGARMFMYWEFRKEDRLIKAIRPVDTITHPEYRGKGIFKKLTLEGLQNCKGSYNLIFNTPNSNSLPGYLKMGWRKYQRELGYKFGFVVPLRKDNAISFKKMQKVELDILQKKAYKNWSTNRTPAYLEWRYSASIYETVFFEYGESSGYLFFRIKKIWGLKVLIVLDYLGERKDCDKIIKNIAVKNKCMLVHYLENELTSFKPMLAIERLQSVVVFREDQFNVADSLLFSSGDLEGRL